MPESRTRSGRPKKKTSKSSAFTEPQERLKPNLPATPPQSGESSFLASLAYRLLQKFAKTLAWACGWIPALLFFVTTTITVVSGFFFFLPRVTVDPPVPYDPSNPAPVLFTIANTNIVPLRDVRPGIAVCFIRGEGIVPIEAENKNCANEPPEAIFLLEKWRVKWLGADEKFVLPLEELVNAGSIDNPRRQIQSANIAITIKYTPWLWPTFLFGSSKQFRFVTKKLSDGRIYWTPSPLYP